MLIDFQVSHLTKQAIGNVLDMHQEQRLPSSIKKMIVDAKPGYPCRLSLADAEVGEEVLLFTYEHHAVNSPYRASGPIYIRTNATEAKLRKNELPPMLQHRHLSLRVYDSSAMMIEARTLEGKLLAGTIQDIFRNSEARYIQVHNAGPGCYNCQIDRVAE